MIKENVQTPKKHEEQPLKKERLFTSYRFAHWNILIAKQSRERW